MVILIEPLHKIAAGFVSAIKGFEHVGATAFQASFDEPPPNLIPSPAVLSTFLMLMGWIERQGWPAAVFVNLRDKTKLLDPGTKAKFLEPDWYNLTDEIDWDDYLDGGIALGSSDSGVKNLLDADTLILNGKYAIYIVGNPERCTRLAALLQEWADRVAPFF